MREVAGDLIVKFADTSAAGRVIAPIVTGDSPVDAASPTVARLSKQIAVPLLPVRVTSGRELLLAIDREQLAHELAQGAARAPGVQRVSPVAAAPTVLPAGQLEFVVQLKADGDLQRQASRDIAARRAPSAEVEKTLQTVAGDLGSQASYRYDGEGRPVLTLDITALTEAAVDRLRVQPDVEYAQANRIMKRQ